ncbi:MAG: MFS transporter, partial [Firmicutes bacterium]|nr:MFS transporter [Bacillota bacterium]
MKPIQRFKITFGNLRQALEVVPPPIRILAIGIFINSVGSALVWPLTTIYVNQILGKSLTMAGFVSLLQSGANLIGQMVGGHLFDRLGGKPVLIGGLWASAAIVTTIGVYQAWPVYATAMVLLGFTMAFFWGPINAYITELWPRGGRQAFNYLYVVRNLGMASGASLGGLVAGVSFRLVFFINAATLLLYSLVLALGVRRAAAPAEDSANSSASLEISQSVSSSQARRRILLKMPIAR